MSKQIHEESSTRKVTIRVSESLIEEYDSAIGDERSRSGAIRHHMRRTVGDFPEEIEPPHEPLLRNGWEALKQAANPNGYVPTRVAKSRIAEATRVKQSYAIHTVIQPLDERGYIRRVNFGKIQVIQNE